MSALDLLVDGFPHGTREGWDQGCRGKHCPALDEYGISCTDARLRYQGDYRFRKRVDAGLSVAEIAAAEREDVEAEKAAAVAVRAQEHANRAVAVVKPKRAPRASVKRVAGAPRQLKVATKAPTVKRPRKPRGPQPIKHGTVFGATRCKTVEGCPEHEAGRQSCVEARRAYHAEYARKRAQAAGFQGVRGGTIQHGTATGYQMGCRKRSECPGADGVTCPDASLAAERERRRRAGIGPARPVVKSDQVVRHLARLRTFGLGAVTIARATGVSKSGVKAFIYGREDYTPTGFGPRHGVIPKHIDAEKAAKLLAFKPWEQS